MIVPVTPETERRWAAMSAAVYGTVTPEEMLEELGESLPHEFVYIKSGEPVAMLSLSLRRDYVEGTRRSPVGYIEGIYVEPEYRKTGIARELIGFAKEWSREMGCEEIASDCYLDNSTSRAFHKAVGFSEAGVNVHFTMDI